MTNLLNGSNNPASDGPVIAIVGGIPHPIGGVTTFIRRVIRCSPNVSVLFDLYPSVKKNIPTEFFGNYICNKRKLLTILSLFKFCLFGRDDVIHFNFSTPKSLLLLLFLPKKDSIWLLTLHHGELKFDRHKFIKKLALKKINFALSLNLKQRTWYETCLASKQIIDSTSYVQPSKPLPDLKFIERTKKIRDAGEKILICSGYPNDIYNLVMIVKMMAIRPNDVLVCCLYGVGPLLSEIRQLAKNLNNVYLFESLSEDEFNYLLYSSDLYLRINTLDSFGISVADAVHMGIGCISTNVCPRYPGTWLISPPKDMYQINQYIDSFFGSKDNMKLSVDSFSEFSYASTLAQIRHRTRQT